MKCRPCVSRHAIGTGTRKPVCGTSATHTALQEVGRAREGDINEMGRGGDAEENDVQLDVNVVKTSLFFVLYSIAPR